MRRRRRRKLKRETCTPDKAKRAELRLRRVVKRCGVAGRAGRGGGEEAENRWSGSGP